MKIIGITLGDQAGVGPEIIEAALDNFVKPKGVRFQILGERLEAVTLGQPTLETAQAALDALEEGAQKLKSGAIDGIVTGPVAKEKLHQVGFNFPGQTEFFADRLACDNYAMCLTGINLTVALVTIHVPLAQVPPLLIKRKLCVSGSCWQSFAYKKRIKVPRIAVCGLNPHAGENGAFGREDIEMIAPAIRQLNEEFQWPSFLAHIHPTLSLVTRLRGSTMQCSACTTIKA